MDAVEYLKQRERMCHRMETSLLKCGACPIGPMCQIEEEFNPEKAAKAVEDWATAHPEEKPDLIKQNAMRIGAPAVLEMTAEECAELAEVLTKEFCEMTKRRNGLRSNLLGGILEEITDVCISVDMLKEVGYGKQTGAIGIDLDDIKVHILNAIKACVSLAHACLKEPRRLRRDNPTPKSEEKCKKEVEVSVWKVCCEIAHLYHFGYAANDDIRQAKIRRMTERLDESERRAGEPLTLEELRQMNNKLVYVVPKTGRAEWCTMEFFYGDFAGACISGDESHEWWIEDYEDTWLAYRRRPEESRNEKRKEN